MFRGVDAKSGDAEAREHEEIVGDLLAHGGEPGIQIGQREQLAVLHIRRVLIVVHRTRRMEIARRVEARIVILRIRGAVAADTGARVVGHVIDHGVGDDVDARRLAAIDHVPEFRVRS
ncbi:MAG: hypothetical protein AUI89_02595 [Gemmatimonadetes bacterium 13_1_40CM_3_65_8]|nr:MAG: hypothetical protein AUH75_04305 [Gemmatimonadetes bacterium 13_1_40CM_4_65_7]OLD02704.1 MAG: hypothetical protein AUI89_02595 [Gemmatimonadetes bacterium 13_1_40CM_3_65_8]